MDSEGMDKQLIRRILNIRSMPGFEFRGFPFLARIYISSNLQLAARARGAAWIARQPSKLMVEGSNKF
jgi:hypothetical protein